MKQNLTLPEMQAVLLLAGIIPASTSPLAGVQPAPGLDNSVMEALRAKSLWNGSGTLTPECQRAVATLADPAVQATIYIEGAGSVRYFAGTGGIAALAPADAGQQRIINGLTLDDMLSGINDLLGWRVFSDGPPLRADLSIDELTTVAAIADIYREEQFRAIIERRAVSVGHATRADAERQIAMGTSKPDPRWLVSILSQFAPQGCGPTTGALEAGAAGLLTRCWVKPASGGLDIGSELETLCTGFASVTPFLAIAVGAPWSEPVVSLFTRGLQHFWSVEFYSDMGKRRAIVSRLGARAMDAVLRQHLSGFATHAGEAVRPIPVTPPVVKTAPPPEIPKIVEKPAAPQPRLCSKCGSPLAPGKVFCTKCGTPV